MHSHHPHLSISLTLTLHQFQPALRLPLPRTALATPAEDTQVMPHVIHAPVESMERFVRRLTGTPEFVAAFSF
jgi:hypothetical protein